MCYMGCKSECEVLYFSFLELKPVILGGCTLETQGYRSDKFMKLSAGAQTGTICCSLI